MKRISKWLGDISYFIAITLPPFLILIVGLYYSTTLLSRISKDTTAITNTTFAILASLSAISFSCSRAIEGPSDIKDRFSYAGERFLHSCILCLTGSVIKYASISLESYAKDTSSLISILGMLVSTPIGVLFMFAILSAHAGLIVLNKLLWERKNRRPEWNSFF